MRVVAHDAFTGDPVRRWVASSSTTQNPASAICPSTKGSHIPGDPQAMLDRIRQIYTDGRVAADSGGYTFRNPDDMLDKIWDVLNGIEQP